jgi:hypothetical protein
MSLKKLGAMVVAVLAIGAIIASSASAAATTEAAEWYTGTGSGTTLPVGTDQAITASIGTKFQLNSSVGGTPVELTATGLECVGCKITNAVVTSGTTPVAMGKGKIKFTGVTADAPTGCTVRNESSTGTVGVIETKPLVVHADFMIGSVAYQQFFPETGTNFATIFLGGGNCSGIEGPYNVKGTVFSKAVNATGTQATTQENLFSQAIQTEAGAELKLGSVKAELSGSGIFSIGGTAFGIH